MQRKFFVLLIMVLCLAGLALAQSDTARIIGTITDPTGAVVSNATITVTDAGTGRVVTAKTRCRRVFHQCAAHRKIPC